MTVHDVYLEATRRGFQLEPRGGKLIVKPGGDAPCDLVALLREHKAELLNWLSRPPCPGWQAVPPGSLPLNPAMPRPTSHDREQMIAYMLRQGCDRPGQLTEWLVRRENDYFAGPGATWDCGLICYAVARDAGCWQLNRSERDVLELLSGFDECSRKGQASIGQKE